MKDWLLAVLLGCCFGCLNAGALHERIDREALVKRHIVTLDSVDLYTPLTVGNGRFAYTADITGLQSFPEAYEKGIPLGTQSEWGWHSFPNTEAYKFEESLQRYTLDGREIPYSVQVRSPDRNREAVNYLRQNPHRLHLGVIGLEFQRPDGSVLGLDDIKQIRQTLNPWNGCIHSTFVVEGETVEVTTFAHQDMDMIAARVVSPLIKKGRIAIKLSFPYPTGQHTDAGCDWNKPDKHTSDLTSTTNSAVISRKIDETQYSVILNWTGKAVISEKASHLFCLEPGQGQSEITFGCLFSDINLDVELPGFNTVAENNATAWKAFWLSGGAVDFSGSTDPRAKELERRVVLSQYLTRVQCAGSFPPQETGLTYNSWHGKFHLEMHYWHGAHYALWGRTDLLQNTLDYYLAIAGKARQTAQRQGYKGLRWPKMTDTLGNDSPSGVGSFLIWQQPHIIYLAELCYRNTADTELLKKYAGIVFETAGFMASFARYDTLRDRYVLGPLLIPAQERFPAESTFNAPFELAYWQWSLSVAQEWRKRLGMEANPEWENVLNKLSPLPQKDGFYLSAESAPDSYTNKRYMSDHPMVTGTYGMLPNSPLIDQATMQKTFAFVWDNWQWPETWGWDFPMTAMAATRLGLPDKAIDALFMGVETNTYLPNGHNYQDQRLKIYLPGNGALLLSIAMMCAGWDGCPDGDAPGFPKDGTWKVKWEGLKKLP